jgi:integrase
VRIYSRSSHYVLQWWDPAAKGNLSDRVDGDLVAAIARARQIEERLNHFRSSGPTCRRLGHRELVERFLQDCRKRANAGEIDPGTVGRYQSALGHYLAFAELPRIQKAFPYVPGVNREFQLAFTAFLVNRAVAPNGHPNARPRRMQKPAFVVDAVRALFRWASDHDRGGLLPEGFANPFLRAARPSNGPVRDLLGEPDITAAMASAFVLKCDPFQLRLFAPLILYGLRAAEPCFLFHEQIQDGWLNVQCHLGLAYLTKGRRDKRFPVPACLESLLREEGCHQKGLFYQRRGILAGLEKAPLRGASLARLERVFQERCGKAGTPDAAQRLSIRNQVLRDAGGLNYDHVQAEFESLARRLSWPAAATVKDFRHLFSTMLANAGMPEDYRRYLLGHAPGRAAVIHYTHLNQIQKHFERAVQEEFGPILEAIEQRARQLGLAS